MAQTPSNATTLAEVRDQGLNMTAYCHGCRHSQRLDLEALIDRLGPDFDHVRNRASLVNVLKCTNCGTKGEASIILDQDRSS